MTFIVNDQQGNELVNQQLVVNRSYTDIEQQIKIQYPQAKVTVYGIGENIILSGPVSSELEKDTSTRWSANYCV